MSAMLTGEPQRELATVAVGPIGEHEGGLAGVRFRAHHQQVGQGIIHKATSNQKLVSWLEA
jgi:hypothetical protein